MDSGDRGNDYFSGADLTSVALVAGVRFNVDLGRYMASEMLRAYPFPTLHTIA